VDSLIDAFVRRDHPSAPAAMAEFYRDLEQATANITALQLSVGSVTVGNARLAIPQAPVFPLRHFQLDSSVPGPDSAASMLAIEQAMTRARVALDRARASTREPDERARLDDIERRFAYGEDVFRLYAGIFETVVYHRRNDAVRARQSFAAVERIAERLRKVRDLVQVSASHANASNGYEAAQVTKICDYLRERYGGAAR
jgi:hypothetical protein